MTQVSLKNQVVQWAQHLLNKKIEQRKRNEEVSVIYAAEPPNVSVEEIAVAVGCSTSTVTKHLRNLSSDTMEYAWGRRVCHSNLFGYKRVRVVRVPGWKSA